MGHQIIKSEWFTLAGVNTLSNKVLRHLVERGHKQFSGEDFKTGDILVKLQVEMKQMKCSW